MTHLLQIHEPGQTPAPHEEEGGVAVGIDLGTTHSVVACSHEQKAEVLPLEGNRKLIPSVVLYTKAGPMIGDKAKQHKDEYGHAIHSIKRFMGEENPSLSKTPEEVSADILAYLKTKASMQLDQTISRAVITVPAYFSENARSATRRAAQLAGLDVLRLLNEPTAAALAYGLDHAEEGTYLVYDLGGGTFDVTLLKCQQGIFQVLATGGDTHLGGDDIDHSMAHALFSDFDKASPQQKIAWQQYARRVKEHLSTHPQEDWVDKDGGIAFSQESFTQHVQPLVAKSIKICHQVLADADMEDRAPIDEIILVGGSSRLPHVWQTLEDTFGKNPLCTLDPDEVVAMGAALQAEALTRGADHLLLDVTPLSLGLETMGGLAEKVITRNTPIPCSVAQEFTTHQDGQTAMSIHIVQGEREMVEDCRSLGQFNLTNIPPLPAGMARIRVTFSLDADGLLSVTAQEKTTGIQQSVDIKNAHGLKTEDVLEILKTSAEHAESDMEKSLLKAAQMDAKQLLYVVGKALEKDKDLLNARELEKVQSAQKNLDAIKDTGNREGILTALKALETITQSFAERRISRSITQAIRTENIHKL